MDLTARERHGNGNANNLPDGVPAYNVSQAVRAGAAARREVAQSDLAELKLAERRSRLVDADQARADVIAAYSRVKTRLCQSPPHHHPPSKPSHLAGTSGSGRGE